ncbi:DUF4185 domain-containing protein [Fodinicola acaciae]|uniref:DUF4185 domain-containing protein n=1 Tax=Fodinicola acaciae TaxID=2681555 RepID=UPI0013D05EE4|nr:DUF4185 domain-containing protein [Fodinicola acaciae]
MRRILAAAAAGVLTVTLAAPAQAATDPSLATLVAKLTGPGSINQTDTRYEFKATDLGIVWDNNRGQVLTAFGDSYGPGWTGPGAGVGDPATLDWRCNALARSNDHDLADGMTFTDMVTDRPGHAKQLLPCRKDGNDAGGEVTTIPTAGVSVGNRAYISYMSVRHWGQAGSWDTNYAGVAYSDDNGQTWTQPTTARWPNNANFTDPFQMNAYVHKDGYVYMFGTPSGRLGDVHLARVPENSVLTPAAYQYWTGTAWKTGSDTQAAPIVTGPAGELSVQYNTFTHSWLMMYLIDSRGLIILREAPEPTGPWSGARTIVKSSDYPALYGGFMHPWSSGPDLYFTMSQWNPYNVFLMHTKLSTDKSPANLLTDPGFEGQTSNTTAIPWKGGGVDRGAGLSHSGANNGFVRSSSGWNNLEQTVSVKPNTTYKLTGWIRTSANNTDGYFGARTTGGTVVSEKKFGNLPGYTQLSVTVNSGSQTQLQVYGGLWANGDTWLQLDDVALTPVTGSHC